MLLVGVQLGELAEEVDERALAKGVRDGGVEGQRWRFLGENSEPRSGDTSRNEITLVQHEDEVPAQGFRRSGVDTRGCTPWLRLRGRGHRPPHGHMGGHG